MRRTFFAKAAVLAAVVASVFLLLGPTVTSQSAQAIGGPAGSEAVTSQSQRSLWQTQGGSAAIVLAIPVALTAVPLVSRRRGLAGLAAGILGLFCLMGAASVGIFYLPAAVLLTMAAFSGRPKQFTPTY